MRRPRRASTREIAAAAFVAPSSQPVSSDGREPERARARVRSLRHETSSFVGREGDLLALERHHGDGARLVTVLGPAGVGKTRLARHYARLRADRGEAVWFCDLTAAQTLAEAGLAAAWALRGNAEEASQKLATARANPRNAEDPAVRVTLDLCEGVVEVLDARRAAARGERATEARLRDSALRRLSEWVDEPSVPARRSRSGRASAPWGRTSRVACSNERWPAKTAAPRRTPHPNRRRR